MKTPDWMALPLAALGLKREEIEERYDQAHYESVLTMRILEKLFAANLLNVELPDALLDEGDTMMVRGILMRVSRVQERRLMLELPPGRRFRHKGEWRAVARPEE